MLMANYVLMILANAAPGRDDDLNRWLDTQHIREVIESGGFAKCRRFEVAPEEADNPMATKRYMHFYEIETNDLAGVKARMRAGGVTPPPEGVVDPDGAFVVFYKQRENGEF